MFHLKPHLDAAARYPQGSEYAALVVEDFGTSGLTGETDDPRDAGNFRSFFYRHSSSHKRGTAGGRWGLGKLVFAQVSAWSCWFGLTTRPDGRTLLPGKAVIGPREVNSTLYRPFARWAGFENDTERPVEDLDFLARFRHCFRLQRKETETGLSVVVPWPRNGPDVEKIRRNVLTDWAVPILRGRLVFEIQGEVIDAAAAKALLPKLLGEGAAHFVEAAATERESAIMLPELRAYPEQKLDEERVDPITIETLRATYERGGTVAVRVPVVLFPQNGEAARGHVDVYLAQSGKEHASFHLRLRDDLTVPRGGRFPADGVHSALLADPGPVARFLADAEPPAHDTWTTTTKLRTNWRYAPQTLNLIRTAPARLHRILTIAAQRDLPDELLQFFWFDDPARAGGAAAGPKRRPRRTPDTPTDMPPPRPRQLTINQEIGGFSVRAGPGLTDDLLPCQIRIRVAYDLEDANPFRAWSPYDFDLGDKDGDVEVEYQGVRSAERQGNQIIIETADRDFLVRAHGFDRNRDLEVRVNRLRESRS